jgi:hypothetical protein
MMIAAKAAPKTATSVGVAIEIAPTEEDLTRTALTEE